MLAVVWALRNGFESEQKPGPQPSTHRPPPPRATCRRVAVSLRGPGKSPVLPFACCVGSLRSAGRCDRCSLWLMLILFDGLDVICVALCWPGFTSVDSSATILQRVVAPHVTRSTQATRWEHKGDPGAHTSCWDPSAMMALICCPLACRAAFTFSSIPPLPNCTVWTVECGGATQEVVGEEPSRAWRGTQHPFAVDTQSATLKGKTKFQRPWVTGGRGVLARGHGFGLFTFGGAYWPLATAHSDSLWVRTCFGCVNGAPG